MNEESMCFLESYIPEMANLAAKQAHLQALASGHSVLKAENGYIVEIFPNGSKKKIKPLKPSIQVTPGQKLPI